MTPAQATGKSKTLWVKEFIDQVYSTRLTQAIRTAAHIQTYAHRPTDGTAAKNKNKNGRRSPMHKLLAIVGVFALVTAFATAGAPTAKAAPAHQSSPLIIPVTAPAGAFTGTFTLTSFALQNGALVANGILSGTDANGVSHFATVTAPVTTSAAASTAAPAAACSILHLVLGPINLNILGLQVTTTQIVLDISASPGSGNLLGNLLCDVANLLNGSPTGALVGLLNQIIAILQGL